MVRSLNPHRWKRIGSSRIGCCFQSKSGGRLWRTSPWIRKMAVSKLALGRKQHKMAVSSLGMMGSLGSLGTR